MESEDAEAMTNNGSTKTTSGETAIEQVPPTTEHPSPRQEEEGKKGEEGEDEEERGRREEQKSQAKSQESSLRNLFNAFQTTYAYDDNRDRHDKEEEPPPPPRVNPASVATPKRAGPPPPLNPDGHSSNNNPQHPVATVPSYYDADQRFFLERFWKTYDAISIVSLFAILGILSRIVAASWFATFDGGVFHEGSALFTNLPLNCLACFLMGLLCDGNDAMDIISRQSKFSSHRRTHSVQSTTRPQSQNPRRTSYADDEEMRLVQLHALERRMRASPSLVLFPAPRGDYDRVEHYFDSSLSWNWTNSWNPLQVASPRPSKQKQPKSPPTKQHPHSAITESGCESSEAHDDRQQHHQQQTDIESPLQLSHHSDLDTQQSSALEEGTTPSPSLPVQNDNNNTQTTDAESELINFTNLSSKIERLAQVNVADGWDVGTTPEAMSADLLLGLRVGFCGALGSFSSWNSDMVNLLKNGRIAEALVGYGIGIQLPIIAYRFGQHVAVYWFVYKCRREAKREERRGYGIRLTGGDEDEDQIDDDEELEDGSNHSGSASDSGSENATPTSTPDSTLSRRARFQKQNRKRRRRRPVAANGNGGRILDEQATEREIPSVRAIFTGLIALLLVSLVTSLLFFTEKSQQQFALSLLFSPLGALARWRLSQKFNPLFRAFPLGTFFCNIAGCALSGSVGSLLAGNPGDKERIVLVGMISGFGGSLSTVATFLVEIINGIDPLLVRMDGVQYAFVTIFWGVVVGFVTSQAKDWADDV